MILNENKILYPTLDLEPLSYEAIMFNLNKQRISMREERLINFI